MGTSISSILVVTTPPLGVVPGPATGLTLSNITSDSMVLSWAAPSAGTPPLQFQPYYSLSGTGIWFSIVAQTTGTTAQATLLNSNQAYDFEVITTNGSGSSTSSLVTGTTLSIPPGTPAGLAVVGTPTQTSISLQWSAPTTGTTPFTYQIAYRTPSGSGAFTPFSPTTAALTETIIGLTAGSGYDFTVTASNAGGAGATSAVLLNVQTAGTVANPPGPATGLTISNLATTSLTLTWTTPTSGSLPFTYQPQVSVAGGAFVNTGAAVSVATAAIAGLSPATAYQFQVITSNTTSSTSTSASVSATTLFVLPSAPTGFVVVGTPTQTSIVLQWAQPSSGSIPLTYQILSCPTGSGSFTAAGAATTALTQTVTGLLPSTGYDLEVEAINAAGTGPVSAVLSNVQTAAGSLGSAPAPATALVVSSLAATSLTLSWTAPASGTLPFSYQIQQAPSGSSAFVNVGSALSAVTGSVTGLLANTGYQFLILTTNSAGSSTSASVGATTLSVAPGSPTGLAVAGSPTQTTVGLQWVAPAVGTAPLTYQVLSRTPSGSGVYAIAGAVVSTLTQTITGLTATTSYDFEVEAINAAGTSAPSSALVNIVTATTVAPVAPSAPTNLTAGAVTSSTIQASWTTPATGSPPLSYVLQWRGTV